MTSKVARSVGVAEQLGAAKAEAEFEAGQLRSQVMKRQLVKNSSCQLDGQSKNQSVSQRLSLRPSVGRFFSQSLTQCVSQLIKDRAKTKLKE